MCSQSKGALNVSFRFKTPEFDLGTTSIENIFLNDFMPAADGLHVKVYLLGFKLAVDHGENSRFNNQTLAGILGVPLSDVADAWRYWAGKSVVNLHQADPDDPFQFDVEFVSLRQLFIDKNYFTPERSRTLIVRSAKEDRFVELFAQIEQVLGNALQPNERLRLMEHLEAHPCDFDLVTEAFRNLNTRGAYTNRISLVTKRLFNWADLEIRTVDDLYRHKEQHSERYNAYRTILKDLGLRYEHPTSGERETIDKWMDTFGFDLDFIRARIKTVTKQVRSPNMNYLDAVFTSEHTGVRPEPKPARTASEPKPARKNRFHNFESNTEEFSEEELEALLLKNR